MPQVRKPQIQQAQRVTEGKTFRERLVDRFKAHEFVRVINIDDEPFSWQYFPSVGEETEFTDNGAVRVVTGRASFIDGYSKIMPGNEQLWMMNPGESEVIQGENAYLFIEGLYKKLVAKRKIAQTPNQEPTKARNFNWNDGKMQEEMIDKIFLGIENPSFDKPQETQTRGPGRPKQNATL